MYAGVLWIGHSFNYAVDTTKHHTPDEYVVPKLVGKKLWFVPNLMDHEELLEQVMRGAIVSHYLTTQEFVDGL